MKWLLFFGCFSLLCSCSGASLTNKVADSAEKTVVTLEQTLPDGCYTDSVKAITTSIKTQIKSIVAACDTEKEVLRSKVVTRDIIIALLVALLMIVIKVFRL